MDQGFNEEIYTINLSYVKTASEIVYDLSTILDGEEARRKRILLKLGNIDLNKSQLLSIESLISSINSKLCYIDTTSEVTKEAASSIGIIIENAASKKMEEPEKTYKSVQEFGFENLANFSNQVEEKITDNNEELQDFEPNEYLKQYENEYEDLEKDIVIPSTPRVYEKLDIILEEIKESAEEIEEQEKATNDDADQELKNSVEKISEDENLTKIADVEQFEELDTIYDAEKKLDIVFDSIKDNQNDIADKIDNPSVADQSYTDEDIQIDVLPTKYIKQTIRSGQIIKFDGNIVIIGDCHPGCEIIAAGDITVWGVLGGIAHAGSKGNEKAKIRALKMNAIQLRISNCYARRPDYLHSIFVDKTNTFTPEEARIVNGEIIVFKIND